MAARDRQAHVGGLRAATRDEAQAVEPGRSDVGRAKLGIGGLAVEHDARLGPGREAPYAWIVGVQQGEAVRRQRRDQLGLPRGDGLDARSP